LKIIYLHQYFNTPEMSGGTRSYEMARRMVAAGHEVHMVTSIRESSHQHDDWFTSDEAGIQVHWYPVPYSNHMSYAQRIGAFLSFAKAARKKAVELEGDVIFATSTPLTIALPAVPAARKKKIPMVFEVRDLWPEMPIAMGALNNPVLRFAAHKLEHWAYKNAAAVVALSPGMKAGVVATGYSADKVAVIPNSSDNREFAYDADAARQFRTERQWLGDKPLLVYTGTFGKVNGVGYMVELASALQALGSDVLILLVGGGAERDSVKQAAEKAGVYQNNLFIEDPLPKKAIPALLSAATMASALFIDLPEMRPNSANKFFDALASGTPVLLNYGGWMHDLVTAHECGLPLWQRSVDEVAEILDAKMHDQAWLDKAGQAARKLAEECFDRDLLAAQLMAVLQSAVDGNPEKAAEIAPGRYD
jgi:glycosyltransferase involved in cell wall biosynthesis